MKDIVCLIPTWLTATHALNAYKSLIRYYPDLYFYFVDDTSTQDDINQWHMIYNRGHDSFDPDSAKLIGLPNSSYILRKHTNIETDAHGEAVTYAMNFIHAKWVIHLSTDVRIIKPGLIEYVRKFMKPDICGIGEKQSVIDEPGLGKWLMFFRGDIYHKHNLDFYGHRDLRMDCGQDMIIKMRKVGYEIVDTQLGDYYIHLGSNKNNAGWDKYYEIQ